MDSEFSFQYLLQSQQEKTMGKEMEVNRASTMSMESAIQRELAYRREDLQLQPCVDSGEENMAVQVLFPSQNPSRPNPNSSPRIAEEEQLASLSNFECQPSSRPSQNPSSRPNGCSGPRISERKQLELSSKSPPQQLQPFKCCNLDHQSLSFFCEVCQVPCSGSLNYKQHLNGKKHKVKLQELKFSRKDGGDTCATANQKSGCELCNIWCTDDNLLKQHLAGKKHKEMQEKLEHATTVGGDIVEELNCGLCGIGCSSKELLQMHFNGKKHQAELRKLECAQKGSEELCYPDLRVSVGHRYGFDIGEEARNHQPKRCKLCNTRCADKNSLQIHLREKKHFLNELETKKRQWQDMIRDLEGNSS